MKRDIDYYLDIIYPLLIKKREKMVIIELQNIHFSARQKIFFDEVSNDLANTLTYEIDREIINKLIN